MFPLLHICLFYDEVLKYSLKARLAHFDHRSPPPPIEESSLFTLDKLVLNCACVLCRGLRWYFGTPEDNKEFTRIPSKRIIIRCMTLLDYFHIVHVYWCWWEDSWEQEDPLYILHNVAHIYKKNKFIYFKMCPGRWSIYIYRKCWWVPLPHPPYWFKVTGHTFAVAVNQAIYM